MTVPSAVSAEYIAATLTLVRDMLADAYTGDGIDIWLHASNRLLDGATPMDLVNAGARRDVVEAAWVALG